jgi:hypothetical protein
VRRLHPHQVYHPGELRLNAEGELENHRSCAQFLSHLSHRPGEVSPKAIHLIDKGNLRNAVFVRLVPYGLRLGFHSAHSAKHANGTVENPKRPFHFNGEVNMSRGIDEVELAIPP